MRTAVVAVVKDEERYIAEWIAYQFAIRFDAVILLDNKSTDGTKAAAERFKQHFDVRVFDWTLTTPDYQRKGYEFALELFRNEFAWMACLDADEFLVLDRPLGDMLARHSDAAAIAVPWAMFGSSGHAERPAGLVIESYTQRAPATFGPNRHIKSIVRPKQVRTCRVSHWFEVDGPYVDLAGRAIVDVKARLDDAPDYAAGQLNHYFTRSRADWDAKLARGYHDLQRQPQEFDFYDRNDVRDDSAARWAPKVRELLATVF
ncbi:glycosyltransferase family 2 protein [Limobrevibacterium gyesilva]|uniref:Glycosyltransferase family 2 protein n=1 Tax=Limobrevibacterium gyesilva TaxID=2991712 RepID=A0AA41YRT7_9PROT|nr:glycosyltransferase family 2 protein [Limobrevibacterium gyesilva]